MLINSQKGDKVLPTLFSAAKNQTLPTPIRSKKEMRGFNRNDSCNYGKLSAQNVLLAAGLLHTHLVGEDLPHEEQFPGLCRQN